MSSFIGDFFGIPSVRRSRVYSPLVFDDPGARFRNPFSSLFEDPFEEVSYPMLMFSSVPRRPRMSIPKQGIRTKKKQGRKMENLVDMFFDGISSPFADEFFLSREEKEELAEVKKKEEENAKLEKKEEEKVSLEEEKEPEKELEGARTYSMSRTVKIVGGKREMKEVVEDSERGRKEVHERQVNDGVLRVVKKTNLGGEEDVKTYMENVKDLKEFELAWAGGEEKGEKMVEAPPSEEKKASEEQPIEDEKK